MLQASIYHRIIDNENTFYMNALKMCGHNEEQFDTEFHALARASGINFLPWWKIWFKKPELHHIARVARNTKLWKRKYYFYYLVQKV